MGREKSTLMILSALKIHTYLCTNQQIHDILKERKIFKVIRKSAIEVEELRDEKCESYRSSIYHSLGATLCTSMFNICLLQCVIGKSIFTLQMQNSLSLLDSHYAMHHHLEIEERIYNWKQAEKIYGLADLADSS